MPVTLSCWQAPPQSVSLCSGQLHLWRFPLDPPLSAVDSLQSLLNSDELIRAKRLLVPEKRQQFIVARANLRKLLALYLGRDPAEIVFGYGHHGKPFLQGEERLDFNLAHSSKWALLAVTRTGAVGVDIEQIDSSVGFSTLAARYFAPQEQRVLTAASEHRKRRTFYRLWTQKEAFLKQSGNGFSAANGYQSVTLSAQRRSLPITKKILGAVVCSSEVTSISRYQPAE